MVFSLGSLKITSNDWAICNNAGFLMPSTSFGTSSSNHTTETKVIK